jgi:Fe-S-cluster containining protein
MTKPDPNFYAEGIRFECQGSGKCFTSRGAYGYVYLTPEDRKRFAKFFGLTTSMFTRKHCETTDGHLHLKLPEADCSFLRGKRCSVYEARPAQCRTWPFWPENMNAKAWSREVKSFCPGVGKGKVHTREEIEAQLGISTSESK